MPKVQNNDLGLVGVTGEYFVAAELSLRGYIANLTLKNTKKVDLLVLNPASGKSANIQIKTSSIRNSQGWCLNKSVVEKSGLANHFYVLVSLKEVGERPDFFIFPEKVFIERVKYIYSKYISTPKKNGKSKKEVLFRWFDISNNETRLWAEDYRDNWNVLGI